MSSVRRVLAEQLGVGQERLGTNPTFAELGADSLATVEMVIDPNKPARSRIYTFEKIQPSRFPRTCPARRN